MKIFTRLLCITILTCFIISCSEKAETISLFPLKQNGGDFYFFDSKGTAKNDRNFAYAGAFRDGLAIVKLVGTNGQYVFVNENAQIEIDKNFKNLSIFSEGLAWVSPRNQHPIAIDQKGKEKFSIKAEHVRIFKDGLSAYSVKDSIGEKWGFVDSNGKTVIQPKFYATGDFNNGICAVMNNTDQWGFIDKKGEIIIAYKFDTASNLSEDNLLIVSWNDKFGIIDTKGEYLLQPKFDSIVADKKTFLIKQNEKWGWIDQTGKTIIEPQFEDAIPFYDAEWAVVKQNGLYGYIDNKGTVKIEFQFKKAYPFMGEVAYVETKDSEKGSLINSEGKIILRDKFAAISADLVAYLNGGKSTYEIIQTDYFDIESIIKSINLNSPEGLSLNDKISDVSPKLYHKKVTAETDKDLTISFMKKITNEAFLNSYIIRNKDDNNKIDGFWYEIEIAGEKHSDKQNDIEKALIKTLKGYTKIEAPNAFINQDRIKAFKNYKHILLITGNIVEILNLNTPVENFESRSYGNHQNTDTDGYEYEAKKSEILGEK